MPLRRVARGKEEDQWRLTWWVPDTCRIVPGYGGARYPITGITIIEFPWMVHARLGTCWWKGAMVDRAQSRCEQLRCSATS
jgi:hypothetical protein